MLSDERIEQLELEVKVLRANNKGLKDKIDEQSKEIEELKETLKCTQNSWYEDTQKIEEMKKQIDLDSECEIALNNRIMDLENADKKWENKIKAKIEEVKDGTFDAKIVLQSLLEKE